MDAEFELLLQTFLAESEEGLATMEEALLRLEETPDDPEPLNAIFRVAHTLKGSAGMVGYDNVAEFAHLLEDALEHLRAGAVRISPVHINILLQAVDAMRDLVQAARNGRLEIRAADRRLLRLLAPQASRDASAASGDGSLPSADRSAVDDRASARAMTLRVRRDRLDSMLDLTGEVMIARGRLSQLLEARRALAGDDVMVAAEHVDRLLSELQDRVMRVRMVPLGPPFRQYIRTVRDLAITHGKRATLSIIGDDVELDASVLEHLRDPLTHMIRNALDHGIESAAARAAAGKPPVGRIALEARQEGGNIVVVLSDDGAGMNRERILTQARARGLVGATETLTDRDTLRLIFEPGFSTAEAVTDLSGRGVGMDVVRRNIELLHGSVSIESVEGAGTSITLRLPLTLAIIEGFTVRVGSHDFVIPLGAVVECVECPVMSADERSGVLALHGGALPYARLRTVLGLDAPPAARESIVVVRHPGGQLGLVVDHLIGHGQVVVKPLGDLLDRTPGIAASTIVGDGHVALILDVAGLAQRVTDTSIAA